MAYKGKFVPRNPSKYKGDPTNIIYRSRWEVVLFDKLDSHPDVISWSSEEIIIFYKSPIDGRMHRYFPDVWVKKRNHSDGQIVESLIEIKPRKETIPPVKQNKPTKRYVTEVQKWGINSAKWEAAQKYCKAKGWEWIIMTEKELGLTF